MLPFVKLQQVEVEMKYLVEVVKTMVTTATIEIEAVNGDHVEQAAKAAIQTDGERRLEDQDIQWELDSEEVEINNFNEA